MLLRSIRVKRNKSSQLCNFKQTTPTNCGLAAIFSQSKFEVQQTDLMAGLKSLHHRGPDSSRSWTSKDRKVALGHTRLSIIDLSEKGNQPLCDDSGDLQFIVNGEIYDYKEHKKNLQKDYQFKTESDSEVVLALYKKLGINSCLQQLRGEFAIVGWDSKNKQLFAARDRFGIKPLYYSNYKGKLYIASEIKALLKMGVPAIWDLETCIENSSWPNQEHRTCFKHIFQVPPGHYIQATPGGGLRTVKYWDLNYLNEYYPSRTPKFSYDLTKPEEHYIQQVRECFLDSVKTRLVADVPVGVYLSGGLDSCSILGAARHILGPSAHVASFSISFNDPNYDEAMIAKRMAESVNADCHILQADPKELTESLTAAVTQLEQPIVNISSVAKFLLSRFVRDRGYKVVLTGEGSDECFGGYGFFAVENYLRGELNEQQKKEYEDYMGGLNYVANFFRKNANPTESEIPTQISNLLGYTPYLLISSEDWIGNFQALTNEPFSSSVYREKSFAHLLHPRMQHWHPVNVSLYLWTKTGLANFLLTALGDRMEMAHSVEGRVPFLDHNLMEMVSQIPTNIKINPKMDKWLLRQSVKPFITEEIYNRRKHPFLGPASVCKGTPLFDFINGLLRSPTTCPTFINQQKAIEKLDLIYQDESKKPTVLDDGPWLMAASFSILQTQYNIQTE